MVSFTATRGALTIDRRLPLALGGEALDTAVLIDVFRATSTAIVLISRGIDEVVVVATPADLGLLPAGASYLVFSELAGLAERNEVVDNSPAVARTVPLEGRVPVLVTTNGTRGLCAAARVARRVLVASFLNAEAVARHILAEAPRHVTLVPAGDVARGERHIEDEACADAIEALLRGAAVGWREIEDRCRADPRLARRIASAPGLVADAEEAFSANACPVVAEFRSSGGVGRIVRAP